MKKIVKRTYRYIWSLVALTLAATAMAQNMTSSPFSRYAYGDMNENVPTAFRSMGGVGIGMRNNKAICPAQPASYTACDTLTFMMDVSASASWSRYQDATGMRNRANGTLEYLTFQIPLWKRWIALSAGLLPYSSVGYSITETGKTGTFAYTKDFEGSGNISQVYGGLSFNICNWFAAGVNLYYMWGSLEHMRTLYFTDSRPNITIQDEGLTISDVRLRYGAQLFHTWGSHSMTVGAVFENKTKLNSKLMMIETQSADTSYTSDAPWELPMVWGVGASYNWDHRLTVAFDYERQCMASALYNGYPGSRSELQDRNRYALGFEYRHNMFGRKYVERMMWRIGASIQDEYLASIGAKRYSAGIGIGFPVHSVGTVINMSIEYSHRGSNIGLVDNSMRFTIGASIAENWFFKRRL